MSEWLAGKHVVAAALTGGARDVHEVRVRRGSRVEESGGIAERARAAGVPAAEFDASDMPDVAGRPAAVAARCGPFRYRDESQLPTAEGNTLVVVLDRIQDPQNLGAMIRTAEAAGARALCIPARHSAQITPAVVRASAGATEHLPIHQIGNVARTLEQLADLGYWSVGLAPEGAQPWNRVDYRGGVALVVGAEGEGLRRLVAERCDHLVALPMRGRTESLNANAAFAAVVFEVVRQQGGGGFDASLGCGRGGRS